MYRLFTCELLHNLYEGITKLLRYFVISYLGNDELMGKAKDMQGENRLFSRLEGSMMRGCNVLLVVIE